MAFTPNINAPEGGVWTVYRGITQGVKASESGVVAVYNKPTIRADVSFAEMSAAYRKIAANISVTFGEITPIYRQQANRFPVTHSSVMVVYRGKVDNPKLKAWWYTLDGHDYYILKLGTDGKTLVFDLSTEQWSWWATSDSVRWRASIGMNWRSSYNLPFKFGSNVIVGDDSAGALWILDPEKGLDDIVAVSGEVPFDRVATGQSISRGRISLPVYSVYLTASLGKPDYNLNSVTLEYSDDQGNTYTVADAPQVAISGGYDQQFVWRSLGQITSPGRLFRITDDGAFARIDGLDVNTNEQGNNQ